MKMMHLTYILIAILVIAGVFMVVTNSDDGLEPSNVQSEELFIRYTEGGGFDIYEDGDRFGYTLEIYFSGETVLYERMYQKNAEGDSRIVDVESNRIRLDQNEIELLNQKLETTGFFELKQRLPDVSPHEVEFRTPAERVTISARLQPSDQLYNVSANLGVARRYYPENFFELRSKLRDLITRTRN